MFNFIFNSQQAMLVTMTQRHHNSGCWCHNTTIELTLHIPPNARPRDKVLSRIYAFFRNANKHLLIGRIQHQIDMFARISVPDWDKCCFYIWAHLLLFLSVSGQNKTYIHSSPVCLCPMSK